MRVLQTLSSICSSRSPKLRQRVHGFVMPRALLSVSDKIRSRRVRARSCRARLRARLHRRHRAGARISADLPVIGDLRRHRLSRDDGRPRQDAAPAGPRRHPRAPRPADDLDAATAHGITLIDLVVVNLYPFVKAAANPATPFDGADRGDRHRRAEPGARGRQELRGRAGRRVAVRLRRRARAARSARRTVARVPLRAGAQGVRAHRRLRHGHRLDARHDQVHGDDGLCPREPARACPRR